MEFTKASISSDASSKTQQFNFLIGNWNIQQKILQQNCNWLELSAKTSVAPTLDGYALIEHWEGETLLFWEGMDRVETRKGLSLRAYDPNADKWNIYWMDTQNRFFRPTYSGNFIDGKGQFFGEEQTPEGKVIGRITFSNIMSDSVHWDFALSNREEGWKTLWVMKMQREDLVEDNPIDTDRDGICPGFASHIARKKLIRNQ